MQIKTSINDIFLHVELNMIRLIVDDCQWKDFVQKFTKRKYVF
jgi:hypothetical protein